MDLRDLNQVIEHESCMVDKTGRRIKSGDVIYNKFNNPTHEKIIEIDGILCFKEDSEPITDSLNTKEFWEVVK